MGFGKIFDAMFTGSMYGAGPVVVSVWAYVIANAKPPGVVDLNAQRLADIIGKTTPAAVQEAIAQLCAPDPQSRNPDEDGRRLVQISGVEYRVVSFGKYRDMRDDDHRREYMREYMAQRRAAAKGVNGVNSVNPVLAPLAQAEAEAEAEKRQEGADAPSARSQVFTLGANVLVDAGMSERTARSFIGRLLKDHDDATVNDAFLDAAGKTDPGAYVRAILRTKPKRGERRAAEETAARRRADEF